MKRYRKRSGYTFTIEDNEAVITIIRPVSGEYLQNNLYLVVYENAYGQTDLFKLTRDEIAYKYDIMQEDLEDI